jgi:hypothetical protein
MIHLIQRVVRQPISNDECVRLPLLVPQTVPGLPYPACVTRDTAFEAQFHVLFQMKTSLPWVLQIMVFDGRLNRVRAGEGRPKRPSIVSGLKRSFHPSATHHRSAHRVPATD